MSRRYRLKDWDFGDELLQDPGAEWRSQPATEWQLRRLEFFGAQPDTRVTRGEAQDRLDSLEGTLPQFEEYQAWKLAGHPDLKSWQGARRKAEKTRLRTVVVLVVVCLFVLLFPLIASRKTSPRAPAHAAAPKAAARATSASPRPAAPATGFPRKARLLQSRSVRIPNGVMGIPEGATVELIEKDGENFRARYQGEILLLAPGEIAEP